MSRGSLHLLTAVVLFCSLVAAVSADAGPDYREFNFMRFMATRKLTDAKCKVNKGSLCPANLTVTGKSSASTRHDMHVPLRQVKTCCMQSNNLLVTFCGLHAQGGSCEDTTVVIPPGSARVIELTAPELSVLEVGVHPTCRVR